ncbi:MAG: hypothetical protein P8Y45_21325 [Exilibacterium sp.]
MNYALTLRKEAEFDIGEHFDFYEGKREGLGHDFLLCVEEALDKLQRNSLPAVAGRSFRVPFMAGVMH